MNEEEWAKRDSELLDQHALEFDSVCEDHLKSLRFDLNSEFPPYPPAHTVTLARAVHALAMRTLADAHPAKRPGGNGFVEAGWRRLHRYWVAVFRINDGVNLAAKSVPPSICLRDRLTALPVQSWRTPSPEHLKEWERAVYSVADKQAAKRRAVEIMFNQPTLAPHFDRGVVVSLAELDAWAIDTGMTDDAGVTPLLRAMEAETAERARITAEAIAKERGEAYEPTATPETTAAQPEQTATEGEPVRTGRPPSVNAKAKIVHQIIVAFEQAAGKQFDAGALPGKAADLLDACQRIEKVLTRKNAVTMVSPETFKGWLRTAGFAFPNGRTPKDEEIYWTHLVPKTMSIINTAVFTGDFPDTPP